MATTRTLEEKLADWHKAYLAIQEELSPKAFRALTELASLQDPVAIQTGMAAARIIFANDRTAATVAALLTTNGVKPVSFGEE